MPALDPGRIVERKVAVELAREAKINADRAENERRIREGIESGSASVGGRKRGCKSCGDPHAAVNENGECDLCVRDSWVDAAKEKLSPEELHPEHFPERDEQDE